MHSTPLHCSILVTNNMVESPAPLPDLHHQPPSSFSPVVISLIGIISTIFLLLSYYKILKRHCFSLGESPTLRYRAERQLINEASANDSSLQFQSRGLDSTILYSLPTIQYKKKSEVEGEIEGETDCTVCLGEFKDGEWLRFLPNCTHLFHISCIDTWFESHSNCPLCRSSIVYSVSGGYSVSMLTLFETLRREDVVREGGGGGSRVVAAAHSTAGQVEQISNGSTSTQS